MRPAGQTNLFQKLSAAGARLRFRKRISESEEGSPELESSLSGSEPERTDLSVDLAAGSAKKNEVESLV